MSRSLLLYFLRTKRSMFERIRVKSFTINGSASKSPDTLSIFTCNINPSASWRVQGQQATNTWIPLCDEAASGLLFTSSRITGNFQWSAEVECRGLEESIRGNTTFSLNCSYENDQGVINIPVSYSLSTARDELFLYYVFSESYTPPTSECEPPSSIHLVPMRGRVEDSDKHSDLWPKKVPVLVGHAGAGVHRAHYSGGREWPENTVSAFRRSEQLGLEMVECDATVTRGYEAVVLHHNFTVGLRSLPHSEGSHGRSFVLEDSPDGPVTKDTPNLIVNYTLNQLRKLFGHQASPTSTDRLLHPAPLTLNDPEPDQYGLDGQPLPELDEVFRRTSTRLGFNVEMKYPRETLLGCITCALANGEPITNSLPGPHTYFAQVNKFCDKVLDVIWKNAGPRPVILSSFNADLCAVLRLKQSHLPVLFITRGGISSKTEPPNMMHVDLRHSNLPVAISWAHIMNLSGVVTLGQHFGSAPNSYNTHVDQVSALVSDMQEKQLACLVYGEGVSETSFLEQATDYGLTGVIIDRVDSYMQEYANLLKDPVIPENH